MSWGCRHNDSVILQRYDADGVCNVLARRRDESGSERDRAYFDGALDALAVILGHEWDTQEDFFEIFDTIGGAFHEHL